MSDRDREKPGAAHALLCYAATFVLLAVLAAFIYWVVAPAPKNAAAPAPAPAPAPAQAQAQAQAIEKPAPKPGAPRVAPEPLDPRFAQGKEALVKGNADEGLALLEQLSPEDAAHPDVPYLKAAGHYLKKNPDEATRYANEALSLEPRHAGAATLLGRIARESGRLDEAAAHFEKVVSINPADTSTLGTLVEIYYQKGNFTGCEEATRQLLARSPGNFRALAMLAHLLEKRDQPDLAQAVFTDLIRLHPDHVPLRIRFAQHLAMHNRQEDALEQLQEAQLKEPHNPDVTYALAQVAQAMGNGKSALHYIQKTVELNPDHLDALVALGNIYGAKDDARRARAAFEKVLQAKPGHPVALNGLGYIILREGDHAKARTLFETALSTDRSIAAAWRNLAACYEKLGDTEKAQIANRQAAALAETRATGASVLDLPAPSRPPGEQQPAFSPPPIPISDNE